MFERPPPSEETRPARVSRPRLPPRAPPARQRTRERVDEPLANSLTPGEAEEAAPSEALEAYEELEVLGSGATGVVTLAQHRETGTRVAIKRLRRNAEHLVRRFLREAATIACLDHPGIVRLLEVVPTPGGAALLLEPVEGPDLGQLLAQQGRLELVPALELAQAMGEALAYAHARGVVHRDLKPSNVLLAPDGRPKLADFGLALPQGASSSLTGSQPCGTPGYMAPEQWSRPHEVDGRADIYALGATLYRMLTGSSPRVIRESRLPVLARELVLRCVEEDPAERFPTMEALGGALERLRARALRDASGVHAPLERISRRLKQDLAGARARSGARRLAVAASGLAALGLLDAEVALQLAARVGLGSSLDEELERLCALVLREAARRGRARPGLLADAHAVLQAALPAQRTLRARQALEGLREASREPYARQPEQRLSAAVARLGQSGALSPRDLAALAASPAGDAQAVLERVLTRLRRAGSAELPEAERDAQGTRWRRALDALEAALPDAPFAGLIRQERLALELRALAPPEPPEREDPPEG